MEVLGSRMCPSQLLLVLIGLPGNPVVGTVSSWVLVFGTVSAWILVVKIGHVTGCNVLGFWYE